MKQQTEQKSVDFSEAVGGGWHMIVLQNKYCLYLLYVGFGYIYNISENVIFWSRKKAICFDHGVKTRICTTIISFSYLLLYRFSANWSNRGDNTSHLHKSIIILATQ